MVTPTNVRAGRVVSVLGGLQAAKGTPVDDFTTGTAGRLWTEEADDRVGPRKNDPAGWMTQPQIEAGGRYTEIEAFLAGFSCKATPFSLELLLRSNWGAFAAGSFTLASQVNEWLSAVLVEDNRAGATHNYHRIVDAWAHTLTLGISPLGDLLLEAEIAAEVSSAVAALDAPGGTFGPSAQLAVADKNVFPGRLCRLFRDPAGDNQEIALHSAEITIDQGLETYFDQMRGLPTVFKAGFPGPKVTIRFEALVSAETWDVLENAIAGVKQRYRFSAVAQAPVKTLLVDFYAVDFEVAPMGHDGREYVKFSAEGLAQRDGSGNFVTISLT